MKLRQLLLSGFRRLRGINHPDSSMFAAFPLKKYQPLNEIAIPKLNLS